MNDFKKLVIFVEGPDDVNFVERVIKPRLSGKYDSIKIVTHAKLPKISLESQLKAINKLKNVDYLFVCDMDTPVGTSLCITERKVKAKKMDSQLLDTNKIIVIKEEIESCYLAGASESFIKANGVKKFDNTDSLTKEQFEQIKPKSFNSITDFKLELLKDYSLENGIARNSSLKYINRKFL